jgi:hypothetical protein
MDIMSYLTHMRIHAEHQRQLGQMQQLRHQAGAYNALMPRITLANGGDLNEIRGVAPFMASNAARGKATAMSPASVLGGIRVYHSTTPAPAAPRRRRGRARK